MIKYNLTFQPGKEIPIFGMMVTVSIQKNDNLHERAILTKTNALVVLNSSKPSNLAEKTIQFHTEKLLRRLLQEMLVARVNKYGRIRGYFYKSIRVKKNE